MYSRLPGWIGPVTVEWTPDEPGVAEARRQAVLATLQRAGRPLSPDRVVIGPSVYPGTRGVEAANDYHEHPHSRPAGRRDLLAVSGRRSLWGSSVR